VTAPLTILHLSHEDHAAGSTISIALLAAAQRDAGHAVLVGCEPGSALADLVRERGLETVELDFARVGPAAARVAALASGRGAHIVNAHASRDRAACRRARFLGRLPAALVMTRRGMPKSTPLLALASGLAADRVIAVSRPVARALARRGTPPWRITVVHNAVDLARIDRAVAPAELAEARALAGCDPARPTIGVVARRKDQKTLLEALCHLLQPVTLCCLGIEPDGELAALAQAVPRHRVSFVPFRRDVRAFYDSFDVVALPTRHEGCSQALLEAMALGKAIVTTRAGGNTDLIDHGAHGLLVPPRDAPALAGALEALLGDPDLAARVGASARRRARARFTVERTLDGTDAAYRAALARRAR